MIAAEKNLVIVRTFFVPRTLVWQAWTDPTIMVRWLPPHGLRTQEGSVEADLRVGGTFRFTMVDSDGVEFPSEGEYLELREPEFLRSTWGAPHQPIAELEVLLSARGARETEMTFRLRGQRDDTHRDDSVWTGWREAVEELSRELEGNQHG